MNHFLRSPLLVALLAAACGDAAAPATPPAAAASAAFAKFVLAADPGPALGVVDAKLAGPADQVVAHGRIAEMIKGLAAFKLMDTQLPYCGETDGTDRCETPWDYCCEQQKTRTANSMFVELRGADGRPLAIPELPGLRLLDDVKVQGKLIKDADGNFTLVATGLFRSQRPELPANVKWPQ